MLVRERHGLPEMPLACASRDCASNVVGTSMRSERLDYKDGQKSEARPLHQRSTSNDLLLDNMSSEDEKDIQPTLEHDEVTQSAVTAEELEGKMTLREGLRKYPKAILWSMGISMTLVMEGYDTLLLGNMTALPQFRQKYGYLTSKGTYQLSAAWQSAIGYAPTIGAVVGILIFSSFQQRYGYPRTIQLNLILITGFLFIVVFAPNIQVLFVGEFLCGLNWGCFSTSAISYASELLPVALRVYLTTFVSLCWVFGQIIGSGTVFATHGWTSKMAYRLPFALQWMWIVPLFVIASLAPESPWYLVRQGRYERAEKVVKRLRTDCSDVEAKQAVALMIRTNQIEESLHAGTSYLECFRGVDLRRTEIACMMFSSQILTGSSLANHPAYFLEQAGFSTTNALQLDLGLRALAIIATSTSWIFLSFFGRRRIVLVGEVILALTLLLIGILSIPGNTHQGARWAEAAMTFVWVVTWDSTIVAAYAIVGEASSTRLRGKTVGLARVAYNICGVVGGILYTYQVNPTAWNWQGRAGFFWFGSCALTFVWAFFRLPEMRGRSYREIDILFARRIPARQFQSTTVEKLDELDERGVTLVRNEGVEGMENRAPEVAASMMP